MGVMLYLLLALCCASTATRAAEPAAPLTERTVLDRPVIARWTMEEGLPHNWCTRWRRTATA
ncbi:hypothetical protein FHR66_003826 [Xanthomonas sp. F4]